MFSPGRLLLARKRNKLTGKSLAELIGVSPVTISRLEKGNNQPDSETVSALSRVLGFPEEFFFGPEIDELDQETASFRSMKSMTAREREAALSAGQLAYLVSDWLDERFNFPEPDLINLSFESEPAVAARLLREHWGLGEKPISNIIRLLESKGVRVFSLAENTKTVDAFSHWRNEIPFVFLNTFKSTERSRFDAAHELGHLVLHRHGGPRQFNAEHEANTFASEFLMPSAHVLSRVPTVSKLGDLITAKKRWGVSVMALAYRLHKLGILSDWKYRSLCIQMNKRGYQKNEPDGLPPEESAVWKQVFKELWKDRMTKSHLAKVLHIPSSELENLVFGLVEYARPWDARERVALRSV